jgi:hypothetical protein
MSKELIERTAVHEAGHVTMAYYFRRSCNYTDCSLMVPGQGSTEVIWSPDHKYINILTHPKLFHVEIKALSGIPESYFMGLLDNFLSICSAGSAAEIIYDEENSRPIADCINGADNDAIANFIDGLGLLGIKIDDVTVQIAFQATLHFLRLESLRKSVNELTNAILNSPGYRLEKADIEAILQRIGFIPL